MTTIDLNADLGEMTSPEGRAAERAILSAITSANIACGGHAGDMNSMRETVEAAHANHVVIGAHPAFPDRENFGRREHVIGTDISVRTLTDSLKSQITALMDTAHKAGTRVAYVKPHGALYNQAVKDRALSDLILAVVKDINPEFVFMGGPNSHMQDAAKNIGLRFIAEGFIDRRYTDDGHLQSRAIDGAVIADQSQRLAQAVSLATQSTVRTASGKPLSVKVQSLCLHGDSAGAVKTAQQARRALEAAGVKIAPFIDGI